MIQIAKILKLFENLSGREKGYLNKYVHLNGLEIHHQLYVILSKLGKKENAEKASLLCVEKLGVSSKALAALCKKLDELLVEGMLKYDKDSDFDSRILNAFFAGKAFENRNLVQEALKYYKKAFLLAQKHQRIHVLNLVANQYLLLHGKVNGHKLSADLDEFWKTRLNYANNLLHFEIAVEEEHQLLIFANKNGPVRNKDQLTELAKIKPTSIDLTDIIDRVQIQKNANYQIYYWLAKDGENMFKKMQLSIDKQLRNLNVFQKPELMNHLYNFLQQVIVRKDEETFDKYFIIFSQLKVEGRKNKLFYNLYKYINEAFSNFKFGKIQQNILIEDTVWNFAQTDVKKQAKSRMHMLAYPMIYSLLLLNEFDKCLKWIIFLKQEKLVTRKDTTLFTNLVGLLCHFEMDNQEYLPYYIRNMQYDLSKKVKLSAYEMLMIATLKKIIHEVDQDKKIKIYETAYSKLGNLVAQKDSGELELPVDLLSWIKSKIERKSFVSIYQLNN